MRPPAEGRDAREELYVGYLREAPPATARFVRRTVLGLLVLTTGLGVWIAAAQSPLGSGVFEFGRSSQLEGVVRTEPYPRLEVERPGRAVGATAVSHYPLVAFGKHGAGDLVSGLDGERARILGSLVYRDGDTMVEVVDVEAEGGPGPAAGNVEDYGIVSVTGEIVDSKCYLGVMKPGSGKPHRACASLCIRGGIPPVLVVRDTRDELHHLVLVDSSLRAVHQRVLDYVAEPLEIRGRLLRDGATWLLAADPAEYRRLTTVQGSAP